MNEEIFSTFAVETKKALAPVQEFNQLVVDNAAKLVALQIASVQNYYALGFANVKALLEVNDAEAFKAYIGKHSEFVNSVSEQFAGDVKAVAVGSGFNAKAQKLGEESVKAVTETNLQEQTKLYQGRGGTSAETRVYGFRPAFLDTQTGAVYPCCFSDGRPAPMHLFDGLPPELILSYAPSGRAVSVKGSIISGFILGERFYTREEVSKQVHGGTFLVNSTTQRSDPLYTDAGFRPRNIEGDFSTGN